MIVFIDIDGTLADISKRNAKAGVKPERKNRAEYQKWLDLLQTPEDMLHDEPVPGMRSLLYHFVGARTVVVYLTGRSNNYEEVTKLWLRREGFPNFPLIMRSTRDWRKASAYKEAKMKSFLRKMRKDEEPVLIIDDDGDGNCEEMYRRNGWTHLKAVSGGTHG
jgi:hypothetical protein